MDYQDLLTQLKKTLEAEGYAIAASTIRKYTHLGLAPKPTMRSLGRGLGRQSEYPEEALGEIYAAWKLLNGPIQTNLERLKAVRILANKLYESKEQEIEIEYSKIKELKLLRRDLAYLMELWINYCEEMRGDQDFFRVDDEVLWGKDRIRFELMSTKLTKKLTNLQSKN